jgi:alpha-beta hydrolase superfamily lysophospholipase
MVAQGAADIFFACHASGQTAQAGSSDSETQRGRAEPWAMLVFRWPHAMTASVLKILGVVVLAALATLAAMIGFGTADPPPALASISDPFRKVDFSDLPPLQEMPARHGTPIAFRAYLTETASPGAGRVVIAIHGSSATSASLHPLAKALRAEGISVYVPDVRGHGKTGRHGDIDYAGQLDDDLADLAGGVRSRHPDAPIVLLGFSSGGGFTLHAAAALAGVFDRTVLLSPMLGRQSPTVPRSVYTWARPFVPRIIGLSVLDRLGVHAFEYLPVLAFAIPPGNPAGQTGTYSFRLTRAFATRDYAADLRRAPRPIAVIVGEKDQLFTAELFEPTVHAVRRDVPVTVIPDLNHVEITTDPRAVPAIVAAIRATS